MRMRRAAPLLLAVGLTAGCADATDPVAPPTPQGSEPASAAARGPQVQEPAVAEIEAAIRGLVPEAVRMARQTRGPGVAPSVAHWYGAPGEEALGGTLVVFSDRGNRQLRDEDGTGIDWVPGDPRRGERTDLRYAVVPSAPFTLTAAQAEAAIDRAMTTWGTTTRCSRLAISKVPASEPDLDILHAGFVGLPAGVLGITIPFAFIDGDGDFTDLDGDRRLDYAFAVIFYNINFLWAVDADVDLVTVALHEAGHGLSQAHFGKGFITLANGRGHLAPRAVMNAQYTGVQQSLSGSDLAGHCGLWGNWPNG